MISQEEHDEAVAQELVFVRAEGEEAETEIYNWYEETVISDVRADLKEKYGFSDSRLDQIMARGGLRIYTLSLIHILTSCLSLGGGRRILLGAPALAGGVVDGHSRLDVVAEDLSLIHI